MPKTQRKTPTTSTLVLSAKTQKNTNLNEKTAVYDFLQLASVF